MPWMNVDNYIPRSLSLYTFFNIDFCNEMQRVLEDRIPKLLEKLLVKPSLLNPPRMEEGGLILVKFHL